ncbi:nuclear transport factor 2 family protein [Sphingomonas solaris]|uniref:Nuclear transport factor 2 family protein n=2 Tax=Alterirhizorhabdus solaris TaxID=2529389 RepID=A0A558RCX1_9SPHN|nr:nuclear transport factor 2 family protein [Sphingomonas solaris]
MANLRLTKGVDAVDERAITTILIRYATGIDTRDWALFRTCFSEDFEADYGVFGKWRGPREITEYMRAAHLDMGRTLHRITNISIWRQADEVQARSYVDALLMPAKSGGPVNRGIGAYDDRFVRTSEGWQISRRMFDPVLLR